MQPTYGLPWLHWQYRSWPYRGRTGSRRSAILSNGSSPHVEQRTDRIERHPPKTVLGFNRVIFRCRLASGHHGIVIACARRVHVIPPLCRRPRSTQTQSCPTCAVSTVILKRDISRQRQPMISWHKAPRRITTHSSILPPGHFNRFCAASTVTEHIVRPTDATCRCPPAKTLAGRDAETHLRTASARLASP